MSNELTGEWEKALMVVKKLEKIIRKGINKGTITNAHLIEARAVKHIQNQDLRWKKLDPAYKRWKEKNRLSTDKLIATGTLMNSITVQVLKDGQEAFVGVLRKARGKNGEQLANIAAVHEFGSVRRKIPARPLFKPTFRESRKDMLKNYRKFIKKGLDRAVGRG